MGDAACFIPLTTHTPLAPARFKILKERTGPALRSREARDRPGTQEPGGKGPGPALKGWPATD